jgi:signal transduction histidine kinase
MMACFPGIERTDMFATLRRCMERREGAQFENEFAFPDGSTGFFELIVQPVPEGLFLLSHDVTERRRAEASARRHADQLEALNRVARIVSGSLELEAVYDGFVAELRHLLPVDRTSITRLDDAARQWMIVRQWTAIEPTLQPGTWHPLEGSVFGEVVRSRRTRLESPIDPEDRWAESPLLRAEGLRSRMIAPLLVKDRVLGTVSAASLKPQAYSPADLELFQTMATHLALAVENVRLYAAERQHAALLEQRVAERTSELQAANRELEAFSYSVSHDLRAPLRAIEGFSRIVQEDYAASLDPAARGYLDRVRASTVRMGRLIDDLLELSRLGRKDITRRTVAPATLARQALEQLEEERSDRQVEVVIDDLPKASADPELLRQVFINLLSNALKFTRGRQPARIHVGSSKDNGERAYFVNDNGAGFDMIYAGELFGVFQRLHRSDEYEGTGVGLAIVQRIIARHGGRTWAEGAVNRGATFYFTLPKGDDA